MPEPIVKMVDIEKHFGSVIALAGVSFDVHAGECHCLLGDNGAGKSTFIKTMSGVHEPSAGQIFFEGNPMQFADPTGCHHGWDCHSLSRSGNDPLNERQP